MREMYAVCFNNQAVEIEQYCFTRPCKGGIYDVNDALDTLFLNTYEDGEHIYFLCANKHCPFDAGQCKRPLGDYAGTRLIERALKAMPQA